MKQSGIVESVSGNIAVIRIQRMSSCGGDCGSCGGCDNIMSVKAENAVGAREGDRVELEMSAGTIIGAAFMTYIIPIIAMIAGFAAGSVFFDAEWKNVLSGITAMAVSFIIISLYSRKKSEKYKITVAKIIHM